MALKKLTMVAAQAVSFAELFKVVFADGLSGPVSYRVELSEPDGPSTAGGKLALQHVKLIPADGGPTLVIGSANTVDKTAELRTYSYIAGQHAQRFKGASLPIDPARFGDLIASLKTFFVDRGMTVTVLESLPVTAPEPIVEERASVVPWIIPAAAVLAVIGAVIYYFTSMRGH